MYISKLNLINFRNFEKSFIDLNPRFNIIYGKNGNGKTNILESIYYLTNLKPLRDSSFKNLISFNKNFSRIDAIVNDIHQNRVTIILEKDKKKLLLNNTIEKELQHYLYHFKSVIFTPDDLMILKGEPEKRRKEFDKFIFHTQPSYFENLKEYNKILKGRNKLIKDMVDKNSASTKERRLLETLNKQFSKNSVSIYQARYNYLKQFTNYFKKVIKKLSNGELEADLVYKTKFDYTSIDQFLEDLEKNFKNEINKKRTLSGPHLDDYIFFKNSLKIKTFGSQGEIRIYVLAIKIAHILYLKDQTGKAPILILDDISSELDSERNGYLFEFLKKIDSQIFITTTDTTYIKLPNEENRSYFIVNKGIIAPK